MKLAEALLRALKDRGAQAMFGIPGDFALPFFKVAEETQILPLHTLSHEPAVGFAADAAARYSSTLGVAAVTYGAGAFNMVNAVAGAYAEKSPVVVISGAPGTTEGNAGLLLHHQGRTLDTQFQVFKEITVAQARLDDPAKAPAEIARVLGAARALSRPVYLEIPRNMVNDRVRAGQEPLLIAADMGDCLFTAMDMIDAGLMAPGYYAGMGFGVPAGIGAQCVSGGKRILTVVGDGAFQMTGWELGNCRRLGIDPIVILFNNASWEMLRTFQPESAFNDLDDWRFAEMAAGMGGDGVRVRTRAELKAALDKAFATRGRFQLIEAMIPRGVLSDTLARFVQGQKRLHAAPRE